MIILKTEIEDGMRDFLPQSARVHFVHGDGQCDRLIAAVMAAFMTSNHGLEEYIATEFQSSGTNEHKQIRKHWKRMIRKACSHFCIYLFEEYALCDAFLRNPGGKIDCMTAYTNLDCIARAARSARMARPKRKKKLFGFPWFSSAA